LAKKKQKKTWVQKTLENTKMTAASMAPYGSRKKVEVTGGDGGKGHKLGKGGTSSKMIRDEVRPALSGK